MRYRLLHTILALLLLLPISCKQQTEVEEPSLELSATTLTFAKEAGDQSITIMTNKGSWSAFSPQENTWITLTQEGQTLRVHARANDQGQDRQGAVLINAGGLQRRVTIRQSAAEAYLDIATPLVAFSTEGGEQQITYTTNVDAVKIDLPASLDWLSIKRQTHSGFTLVAKPNTDKARRTAQIGLTLGSGVQEITVVQEGNSPYIFPLLDFPKDLYSTLRYEEQRGHKLLYAKEATDEQYPTYRFLTKSKVVPFVQYQYNEITSPGFTMATLLYMDQSLIKGNADFEEAVKAYGFVKGASSPDNVYTVYKNEKLPLQLLVTIFSGGAKLEFVYDPIQKAKYPTFSHLPIQHQTLFLGHRNLEKIGKKQEDVRKYEAEQGSKRDENTPGMYDLFIPSKSLEEEIVRAYFYIITPTQLDDPYLNMVEDVLAYYSKINLAYWLDEIDGHYHLTEEVQELFTKAGFPYYGQTQNASYVFVNRAKSQAYVLRLFKYKGELVLDIQSHFIELDDGGGSAHELLATSSIQRRKAFLNRLSARCRHI